MNLEQIKIQQDQLKEYDDYKQKYILKKQKIIDLEIEKMINDFTYFFEKNQAFKVTKKGDEVTAICGSFKASLSIEKGDKKNIGMTAAYAKLDINKRSWSIIAAEKPSEKVRVTSRLISRSEKRPKIDPEYEKKLGDLNHYKLFLENDETKVFHYNLIEGNTLINGFDSIEALLESIE